MKKHLLFISYFAILVLPRIVQAAPTPQGLYSLKAKFAANVIFSSLPMSEVQKLMLPERQLKLDSALALDPGLRDLAAPYYDIPKENYPVLVLYGVQDDMTDTNDQIFVSAGKPLFSYHEVVFLIPHVMYKGKAFNYLKRLYLDSAVAVSVGKQVYGYDKLLGQFSMQSSDSAEQVQVTSNGVQVAQIIASKQPRQSTTDLTSLLPKLLTQDYLSFSSLDSKGTVICTRQEIEMIDHSLYATEAQAKLSKEFFNVNGQLSTESDYIFDGRKSSLRLMYSWKLYPPDINCQKL